jgi:single-stranded DNA-binding protein
MSVHAVASGVVTRAPVVSVTKHDKPWVRLSIRAKMGEGDEYISVVSFAGDALEELRDVREGQHVAVEGRLEYQTYQAKDGTERRSLRLTATRAIALKASDSKARPRSPRASPAARPAPSLEPFGAEAGDLEGHLPPARHSLS